MKTAEEKRAKARAYYQATAEHRRQRERERYHLVKDRISAQRKLRRDKIRETNRRYVAQHRERYYEYQVAHRRGLNRQQLQDMVAACGNLCEICRQPNRDGKKRLAIDHNHATGIVRGLLCDKCNQGIGMFQDSAALLSKAAMYLQRTENALAAS